MKMKISIPRHHYIHLVRAPALALLLSGLPLVATAAEPAKTTANPDTLEEVVVTGSLIPQTKVETATPVTTITADDLQVRGFSTIADALQQSSFSTGSVQGAQFSYGFTQGAKTLSMFGLSPSYVKYLIDGLPMSDYPALYNGTDTFTSIGGIPMALVEKIDILPGGQSSLYGSDAIAGVVNIILKKSIDHLEADARYGFSAAGGGVSKTFSLADGFQSGRLTVMGGLQYDNTKPIWGYQRGITSQYFANGTSPQRAERDWLVYGLFGPSGNYTNTYYFQDPANCANLSSQYGGSTQEYSRPNRGSYCGTTRAGYYTISNGNETTEGYLRATYTANRHLEVYGDLIASRDKTYFANPGAAFNTTYVNSAYSYFYDPRIGDLLNVQHIFSPEEIGNLDSTESYNVTDLLRATLGGKGDIGHGWSYDASATFNQQKLAENTFTQLTDKLLAFYAPIFGPNMGADPFGYGVSTFEPNYAAFYKPVTPADFAGFSGFFRNHSQTESTLFRAQLTNGTLFKLKGGDAGIALVAEGGHQSWKYIPDAGFATGEFFGFTSSGASYGDRTRSALTTEVRLPVLESLTLNGSARYDDYKLTGGSFTKATWNIGLEFRPSRTLLARARIGTAFKAPTLSDEFQGLSGFYTGATDYYLCAVNGYTGSNLANCPFPSGSVFGQTSGNTKLKPINADVWNIGLVWAPLERLSLDLDYLHWRIKDEVTQQSTDQLLRTEASCRLGQLDIHSPSCVAALAQVTRDPNTQQIVQVYTPKINVSQESLDALTLTGNYVLRAGRVGTFRFELAWTDMLKHRYEQYAGDPFIDLIANPYYSTDFKSKVNGSVTWERELVSSTLYFTRNGRTPNNLATLYAAGYATPGAGTLASWTQANFSLRYALTPKLELSGTVINIANTMPPTDNTYNGLTNQPYNVFNYNPYGRSFRIEAKYSLPR
jgi:outer membrane receptor protein involved in Fe transport